MDIACHASISMTTFNVPCNVWLRVSAASSVQFALLPIGIIRTTTSVAHVQHIIISSRPQLAIVTRLALDQILILAAVFVQI